MKKKSDNNQFDLFSIDSDGVKKQNSFAPLADRMRPNTLDDFLGQEHIVGKNSLLRRAIMTGRLGSCIFWGPPGTGKTTLAHIISKTLDCHFEKLNAVSSGVSDTKRVIDEARDRIKLYGKPTFLLLDECHRFNKAQLDSVLAAIEDGTITFIGSTTENPYFALTPAIISRCRVFEFKKLTESDIVKALRFALIDGDRGLGRFDVAISDEAIEHLVWASSGDLRSALNALELGVITSQPNKEGKIVFDLDVAEQSIQKPALSVDEDLYYDILSAFCKSLRGSDAEAALYYSERLISAGCDPLLILRRLIAHSSEDVGMADPNALIVATSALVAYEHLGLPEGRIPLANAIIYVCEAPKSNSVIVALDAAHEDAVEHPDDNIPPHLRVKSYNGSEMRTAPYVYPHDFGGYCKQQYLPDSLKDRVYYKPNENGREKGMVRKKKW